MLRSIATRHRRLGARVLARARRAALRWDLRRLPGSVRAERIGYGLLAISLSVLLWYRVSAVDGFALDEWVYVRGGSYMWDHFPGAFVGGFPEWTRGLQRLYVWLIGVPWSLLDTSAAYDVSHLLNVGLLASAIVPAALLAHRIISLPLLRLLSVALAVAIPWLMIGLHLLTENLAFPLFLWCCYLAVRAAETPTWRNQTLALAGIAALVLCRTNLTPVFGVLVVAIVAREALHRHDRRSEPFGRWLRAAARREALVLLALVFGAVVGYVGVLSGSATSAFGVYGNREVGDVVSRLFGHPAEETRRAMLTYTRALVEGGFVFPFVLGLAAAAAGAAGRLGRSLVVPSLVALSGFLLVIVPTSAFTEDVLQERYTFYGYAPIVLFAGAAVEHAARIRRCVIAAGVLAMWCLMTGYAAPGLNGGNFFAAPAGAFWSRVLDWRLRHWGDGVLGWTLIGSTGLLLIAAALAMLILFLAVTVRWPRLRTAVLTGGLTLCLAGQVAMLDYGFKQELYGTVDVSDGIALRPGHDNDREDWVDSHLPGNAHAALVPGLGGVGTQLGGAEQMQFWNHRLDRVVDISWNGTAVLAPPGTRVTPAPPDRDGLAAWSQPPSAYLVSMSDDPRVQFAGRVVARSPVSRYTLYRIGPHRRAIWTATNVDGDGAVLEGRAAMMRLDRATAPDVRSVELTLTGPIAARAPAKWSVNRGGRIKAQGVVAPGKAHRLRLTVPPCPDRGRCPPIGWSLSTAGLPVRTPFPVFGPPGPLRPVTLYIAAADLIRTP
ncbi:MAG: hypothetical protein M3296_03155 [Actinomycetota bacterium]|nr:hypothetical protein [Actinomycetota bacterium]